MNSICIITDIKELEGTAYIEVLPGAYKDKCWNDGSLFFDEEAFGYIEPILQRNVPAYDHYAFSEIGRDKWLAIIDDLDELQSLITSATSIVDLQGHIGLPFGGTEERFARDFDASKGALSRLISEFSVWLRAKINENDSITVLGM